MFENEITINITKEQAPWAPDEELGEYTIKRWTWYDRQLILARSGEVNKVKDREMVQLNMAEYYTQMLNLCVSPPEGLDWNPDRIRKLDVHVGQILQKHAREINGLTWEEKVDFLGDSGEQDLTPG